MRKLLDMYSPGQPKWEGTMWKFQDISATRITRVIIFDHFEGPKTAILTIWADLNFWKFLTCASVRFSQNQFKASKIIEMTDFKLQKSAKIDFT